MLGCVSSSSFNHFEQSLRTIAGHVGWLHARNIARASEYLFLSRRRCPSSDDDGQSSAGPSAHAGRVLVAIVNAVSVASAPSAARLLEALTLVDLVVLGIDDVRRVAVDGGLRGACR